MPNGESATATKAVSHGRATQIQAYGKHQAVPGRHRGTLAGQTKALRRGLQGTGIKVSKSNKGIGTAGQQVSAAAARAKSAAMQSASTGDRAWRNRNINKQSAGAARATKNRKRREARRKK